MKRITVVAAVIENTGQFLCVQRAENKFEYISKKYEFPGGKVEDGETQEEALILIELINHGECDVVDLRESINQKYGYAVSDNTIASCLTNLNFEFITETKNNNKLSVKKIYDLSIASVEGGRIIAAPELRDDLQNSDFRRFLTDSTRYSILSFEKRYTKKMFVAGFILYQKYSRKDVLRILNWDRNPVPQNVGGYIVSKDKTNCPIFVNYHKEEDISSTTKYEDGFVNQELFKWMSKSSRTLESPDVKSIRYSGARLPLFIKKHNDEGKEFYYMGDVTPIDDSFEETSMVDQEKDREVPVVKVLFSMKTPVEDEMFEYIAGDVRENSAF